jgi:flagellar L-ring protein FlgH
VKKFMMVFLLAGSLPLQLAAGPLDGIGKKKKEPVVEKSTADYVSKARLQATEEPLSEGSLFRPGSTFTALAPDYKARNVNDLLVIHIVVATTSQAAGSVKSQRTFSASSSLTNIPIGKIGANSTLQNLFSPNSNQNLNGASQTSNTSQLNTDLTARVMAVLPNGVMVVEAVREVDMNNERQTIVLRGMVRPGDVAVDNSIASSALGNLEIELKGKGVISDGVRPPNKIVGLLLKIFGF